jgi:ketosteroid isomerase-like protein
MQSPKHPNEALIEQFYRSFQQGDAAGMIACYDPAIQFSDPVFVGLRGPEAGAMWQMLTGRSKDFHLTYSDIAADGQGGHASWVATYTFTQTGRSVRNVVKSDFRFKDGKIVQQQDTFDLWNWAGQALGPVGRLLGWTPLLQARIRKNARAGLDAFMARQTA